MSKNNKSTKCVHSGNLIDEKYHGNISPLYPSITYDFIKSDVYPRYFNSPNQIGVAKKISDFEEVVEFYRMSGDVDYLLRVVVKNMAAYDTFYKKLISEVPLKDVSSSFAMEEIKYSTALPISQL